MAYYRKTYLRRSVGRKSYRRRTYRPRVKSYRRRSVARRSYRPRSYRARSYRSKGLGSDALKCYRKFGDVPKCQAKEARAAQSHIRRAGVFETKKPAAIAKGSERVSSQLARLNAALGGGNSSSSVDFTMGVNGQKRPFEEALASFN